MCYIKVLDKFGREIYSHHLNGGFFMVDTAKILQVKQRVLLSASKFERKDRLGKVFKGIVAREDILDVLNAYADPKNEKKNIEGFLDSLDAGIVDYEKKQKILNDLESYPVSYKREE